MKEKLKNKDIIMEIILHSSSNGYTEITNKKITEIAEKNYNKKLYDGSINSSLKELEEIGYIQRNTVINGNIKKRTIYITKNIINIERKKNKVLNIINNLKRDECLIVDEVVAKYCEDLLNDDNMQFIALLTKEPTEKIKNKIYNRNKKIVQTILKELTKNNKIIEHRAVKKLGRNVPKKIKDKVQNLPTNTKYYISKKNSKIVEEEEYYL